MADARQSFSGHLVPEAIEHIAALVFGPSNLA
jgi:hypothetical protein